MLYLKIDDYYIDENHLILKSSDLAGEFDIVRYEEFEEIIPILQKEIKEEKNLHINCKPSDYKKNWHEVFRLQNEDGQLIISLEEKNEKDSEYAKFYVLMACVMLVIIFSFCITTIIVGRYPYKFSKRIQKAFFKDGYLR